MTAPPSGAAGGGAGGAGAGGLGDLFSLSGGAGLTAGYVWPKTVSERSAITFINSSLGIFSFCFNSIFLLF